MIIIHASAAVNVTRANNVFGNAAPTSRGIIKKGWRCSGNEQQLLRCPQDSRPNCNHSRDAGVFCYGEINTLAYDITYCSLYNITRNSLTHIRKYL